MAVYTDLFIATEAEVLAASPGAHAPVAYAPSVQAKGITSSHLEPLEAIVSEQTDPCALVDARIETWDEGASESAGDGDGNVTVEPLRTPLVEMLAHFTPDAFAQAVRSWEDIDKMRTTIRRPEHVAGIIACLRETCLLMRHAQAEGNQVYLLWTAV
jgi:hypothetical protein